MPPSEGDSFDPRKPTQMPISPAVDILIRQFHNERKLPSLSDAARLLIELGVAEWRGNELYLPDYRKSGDKSVRRGVKVGRPEWNAILAFRYSDATDLRSRSECFVEFLLRGLEVWKEERIQL